MRNRLLIILILLIAAFTACNSPMETSIYNMSEQSSDVDMKAREYFLDRNADKLSLIFVNNSDKEYTFVSDPILEVESDGTWYVVPIPERATRTDTLYVLPANDEFEYTLDINMYYGKLSKGKYRLVKILFYNYDEDAFTIAEFEITD